MRPSRILVLAGSVRRASLNQRLAEVVATRLEAAGAAFTRLSLRDYPLPIYNGDLDAAEDQPHEAQALHEQFRTHDSVFIASPEYNASVPPLLANALAWLSRVNKAEGGMEAAFGRPHFAIGSASVGAFGDYRGLIALRHMLELGLQARVLPEMIPVPTASEGFDEHGGLRDGRAAQALAIVCEQMAALPLKS